MINIEFNKDQVVIKVRIQGCSADYRCGYDSLHIECEDIKNSDFLRSSHVISDNINIRAKLIGYETERLQMEVQK